MPYCTVMNPRRDGTITSSSCSTFAPLRYRTVSAVCTLAMHFSSQSYRTLPFVQVQSGTPLRHSVSTSFHLRMYVRTKGT